MNTNDLIAILSEQLSIGHKDRAWRPGAPTRPPAETAMLDEPDFLPSGTGRPKNYDPAGSRDEQWAPPADEQWTPGRIRLSTRTVEEQEFLHDLLSGLLVDEDLSDLPRWLQRRDNDYRREPWFHQLNEAMNATYRELGELPNVLRPGLWETVISKLPRGFIGGHMENPPVRPGDVRDLWGRRPLEWPEQLWLKHAERKWGPRKYGPRLIGPAALTGSLLPLILLGLASE